MARCLTAAWRLASLRTLALAALAISVWTAAAIPANAVPCTSATFTVQLQAPEISYNPFGVATVSSRGRLRFVNTSGFACDAVISFTSPDVVSNGDDAEMSGELPYKIQNNAQTEVWTHVPGTTSINVANRVDIANVPAGAARNQNFFVTIAPGHVVASGPKQDTALTAVLFGRLGTGSTAILTQIASVAVTASANVIEVCDLPAPSQPNLVFGPGAFSNGLPNGTSMSTTFVNVRCTAPTRLRLTGSALLPSPPIVAPAGFDDLINVLASGSFGGASVDLTTTGSSPLDATSTSKNTASGATTAGQITVDISLVAADPIVAGVYSGILTVTIDPDI